MLSRKRFLSALVALGGFALQSGCSPLDRYDIQVPFRRDAGSFANPPVNVRPRFRYWIPDASADHDSVARDIADAGAIGAAGVEVLGFYLYGANPGTFVPVDWSTYGWGTPAWKDLFDTIINAHHDSGLIMDFAMGPNQGQGVPAKAGDEGLAWDLKPVYSFVPLGGQFNSTIPGWGTGKLQAVVTALAKDSAFLSTPEPSLPNDKTESRTQYTLAADSLQDVTQNVTADGVLQVAFAQNQQGLENVVFAVYLVPSGQRAVESPTQLTGPQTSPQSFVQDGSWIVDHFSARGAKVMTDFWETYLLGGGTKERLQQVAEFAWEDSVENNPNIYWTQDLPKAFEQRRGYSLNKWYPLIFHQNSLTEHFDTWFVTDEADSGNSHIADYRTTLTEQYGEYLDALRTWANDYLNVKFSAQPGYNMAVDMQSVIANLDAPECEDLAFSSNIDAFRQFSGPANMALKKIVSAEVGAGLSQTYQQFIPNLLSLFKRLFAGGVNALVIHGLPYSGQYPNTTWPGYTTFTYAWSEMHGRHQPSWNFLPALTGYCARHSYLFQSGVAKVDIAFYQKLTTYPNIPQNYQPSDLTDAGYSYQYLNPEALALPEAYVSNGVLGPNAQSFKALVVRGTDQLTVLGAERISQLAHDGLPVIFSGGIPSYLASYNESGAAYAKQALESIRSLSNVHEVDDTAIAGVVASLGIQPLTSVKANSTWWTVWRHNPDADEDYIYIYHNPSWPGTASSEGTIEFKSTGVPYFYNVWTGEQTPIMTYTQSDSTTTIFFRLGPEQTTVVAFRNKEKSSLHAVATSRTILGVFQSGNSLEAHVGYSTRSCYGFVTTSDDKKHPVKPTSAKPFELLNWTLTAEHWDPPSNFMDISPVADKHNTTHQLSRLVSWQQIDGLQHVSGLGYYETSFQWPPTNDSSGAIISFGRVVHTLSVSINGHVLPALDVIDASRDITQYLVQGENKVEAIVSTTLANVLSPIWDDLRSSGSPPMGLFGAPTQPSGTADYGLLDPVVVTPYNSVKLV
ncbi:secreted protein [Thozetella sp. PMI_491]|nr:secreted protein [Thozetella sp. PMI_491]